MCTLDPLWIKDLHKTWQKRFQDGRYIITSHQTVIGLRNNFSTFEVLKSKKYYLDDFTIWCHIESFRNINFNSTTTFNFQILWYNTQELRNHWHLISHYRCIPVTSQQIRVQQPPSLQQSHTLHTTLWCHTESIDMDVDFLNTSSICPSNAQSNDLEST